jgi:hypothetical protein
MSTDCTSCSGKDCPIKENCKRFTGPKEPLYQSYFTEIPGNWEKTDDSDEPHWQCKMFWGETPISMYNALKEIMK